MLIETIEYHSLEKIRKEFDISYDKRYIFRGQSNGPSITNDCWGLTSSFKRHFNNHEISFNSFIVKNLDRGLFNKYFSDYSYQNSRQIADAPFIEKLFYLQHYGIPTCLIDFTKDPIIALYFALSSLKIPITRQFTDSGYISFGKERFVTVYQLDTLQLKDKFGIKEIVDRDFCWDYDQFSLPFVTQSHIKIAIDLNPLDKLKSLDNFNLEKQKGCFVLYDNTESSNDIPLEETLNHINLDHLKMDFADPIIIKHNLFLDKLREKGNQESIFSFVRDKKNVTGKELFNDIQGLKFDLLQLHDNW
jgi:hypothetical protein